MKYVLIFFIILLSFFKNAIGQVNKIKPLKIGDSVPFEIWKTIPHNKNTELVILDSWSTFCSSCIDGFPHMVQLQQEFPESLQVILINIFENDEQINRRLTSLNQSRKNDKRIVLPERFPQINGNKNLAALFPHIYVPHHIWLNGKGKVLAITDGSNATFGNVESVLKGTIPIMYYKNDDLAAKNIQIGWDKGFLQPSISNMQSFYYSAIMRYSSQIKMKELNFLIFGDDSLRKTCRFNGLNQYPYSFFEAAFREIGSSNYRVIIETTNKEMFIIPAQNDPDFVRWRSKFSLSYEIVLPLEDKYNWGKLKPLLQEDVNRFFGRMFGIEGLFEKRKYMAYVLVKTEEGSLETNGGSRSYYGPGSNGYKKNEGVSMIKCPYSAITSTLSIFEDMATGHPFIDETGIDKNMLVDFKLTGDITDINNVRPQLKQYGLDIIEAEREVEVLVIRDKVKE